MNDDQFGFMSDFLQSLANKNAGVGSDNKADPDYEKMADDLVKIIYPIYDAFVERGASDDAAISLTIALLELFANLHNGH